MSVTTRVLSIALRAAGLQLVDEADSGQITLQYVLIAGVSRPHIASLARCCSSLFERSLLEEIHLANDIADKPIGIGMDSTTTFWSLSMLTINCYFKQEEEPVRRFAALMPL